MARLANKTRRRAVRVREHVSRYPPCSLSVLITNTTYTTTLTSHSQLLLHHFTSQAARHMSTRNPHSRARERPIAQIPAYRLKVT